MLYTVTGLTFMNGKNGLRNKKTRKMHKYQFKIVIAVKFPKRRFDRKYQTLILVKWFWMIVMMMK